MSSDLCILNWLSINNTFTDVLGYSLSYVELIGTLTGLLSVWLAIKSNILTWPVGLINVFCFFCIFYQVHLYSDMFLQVYFFIASIYGWIYWQNQKGKTEAPIKILSWRQRIILSVIILFASLIIGSFIKEIHLILPLIFVTPASYPFIDTTVAVLSIVATILLAQRKLENWPLWIIVDVVSAVLYARKNVIFISVEYGVFLCLATLGLFTWLRLFRYEKRIGLR